MNEALAYVVAQRMERTAAALRKNKILPEKNTGIDFMKFWENLIEYMSSV